MLCDIVVHLFGGLELLRGIACVDWSDQTQLEEHGTDLNGFAPIHHGGTVHEPFSGIPSVKRVLVRSVGCWLVLDGPYAHVALAKLMNTIGVRLRFICAVTDKAAENDLNSLLIVVQFVGFRASLEDNELVGVACRFNHSLDVSGLNTVTGAEALQYMDALGRQLPDRAFVVEVKLSLD